MMNVSSGSYRKFAAPPSMVTGMEPASRGSARQLSTVVSRGGGASTIPATSMVSIGKQISNSNDLGLSTVDPGGEVSSAEGNPGQVSNSPPDQPLALTPILDSAESSPWSLLSPPAPLATPVTHPVRRQKQSLYFHKYAME